MSDLRAIASAATPGPWRWDGYVRGPMHLSTTHSGRRFVMNFARLGMQDAQPVFQVYDERGNGRMVNGRDLVIREVDYRDDIVGFDNPDARFMETFDPHTVGLLLDVAEFARVRNEHHDAACPMAVGGERATYCDCGHDDLHAALAALDEEDGA